ncbi:hypothetical protein [Variovorax soli]|uniref:hypothetical protein n=1 Tax=Variovorax soli TaxID=376815 RepID=UPI00157C577F|nr:hypothetical protein [Variovorax soli]
MQPFDGAAFDSRYREVYAPAIVAAGLEPYRVDQDPKVSIPIQDIERGIRQAHICLAEITTDNPNVWFELGYAIACGKEVVLICSDQRTSKFPFDVQHRTIIKYATSSPSDFEALKTNITAKIQAFVEKAEALGNVSEITQLAAPSEGFADHEVVAIAAVVQNLMHAEDHATGWQIQRDMEASGYTRIACNFALKALERREFLTTRRYEDEAGESYLGYHLTTSGWDWVLANQDRFALRTTPPRPPASSFTVARRSLPSAPAPAPVQAKKTAFDDMDDDIPF